MDVYHDLPVVKKKYPHPVLCIGVFDGLHRGHQRLIKACVRRAKEIKGTAMVMTFHPHPIQVLRPEVAPPQLTSLAYRLKLLEEMGVRVCWVIHFTRRFAALSPAAFIRRYLLSSIQPEEIFVGDDFRFAQHRSGTLDHFRRAAEQYGFRLNAVSVGPGGRKAISSSTIRQDIGEGRLGKAANLLGRPFSIYGQVVAGDGRGQRLGYPTANLEIIDQVYPLLGVYVVGVEIGRKKYYGVANVGRRPSFKSGAPVNIEVHIFHYKGSLYHRDVLVTFYQRIRGEKIFSSEKFLRHQIDKDKEVACRWLSRSRLVR